MDLLADDCAGILEKMGVVEPVVVCGLSMGGYVSFAFLRRHPQLVAGLILAATRAGADTEEAKINRDNAAQLTKLEGTQPVNESMLPIVLAPNTYQEKPDLVDQVEKIMAQTSTDGMVSALMGMKTRPDSSPTIEKINVPTLIIHGADDQIIPTSEADAMHAAIEGSRLEIIPNAGHLPNLEQPELFNHSVENFLSGLED
jgi:pimeloyl-ACP methyl ester carboxylesterase